MNDSMCIKVLVRQRVTFVLISLLMWCACVICVPMAAQATEAMPPMDPDSPIYEVRVEPGVSYDDVVTSLKVASEAKNFVSPATFPIGDHIKQRGLPLQGVLEVRTYCNLGIGAEIMLDHPEFSVFAPCRIAIYERQGQLYLALDRPTFDLKHIKNPTERAKKAAQQLEESLIWMLDKARKGEI